MSSAIALARLLGGRDTLVAENLHMPLQWAVPPLFRVLIQMEPKLNTNQKQEESCLVVSILDLVSN